MGDSNQQRIKPPALRPGDKVGIVAPASPIEADALAAGCAALRSLGYEPVYSGSILDRETYFAGSIKRRAQELQGMFERDDVGVIVCARGGYGCNYLLSELDIDAIRRHPKALVGYSDVTTLLTHLVDAAGIVTCHGPMVAKDFARPNGVDIASWMATLGAEAYESSEWHGSVRALVEGEAEGILYGGCLSMLVASLGTQYEIRTKGTILLIEDIDVRPYQVDRMLMQLKLAGKLDEVRALIFGEMPGCDPDPKQGYTLQDVIRRICGDIKVPIAYGLPFGHVSGGNLTIPIGVRGRVNVQNGQVRFGWEPATAAPTGTRQNLRYSAQ